MRMFYFLFILNVFILCSSVKADPKDMKIAALEALVQQLGTQARALQTQLDAAQAAGDATQLRAQLTAAQATVDEHRAERDRLVGMQSGIDKILAEMRAELQQQREARERLVAEKAGGEARAREELDTFRRAAEKERDELRTQLQEEMHRRMEALTREREEERGDHQRAMEQLRTVFEAQRDDIRRMMQQECDRLREHNRGLSSEIDALRSKLAAGTASESLVAELRQKLLSETEEKQRHAEALQQGRVHHQTLAARVVSLEADLAHMGAELQRARERGASADGESVYSVATAYSAGTALGMAEDREGLHGNAARPSSRQSSTSLGDDDLADRDIERRAL